MKSLGVNVRIKFVVAACLLAMLWFLSGCSSTSVSPWWFIHKISPADHVVVTNCLAGTAPPLPGLSQNPSLNFSLTITGPDAKEIVHAISSMHTEVDWSGQAMSATFYEWHLQFFRGKKLLGEVGLSPDLIECGDYEYPAPPVLIKLYERIEQESRSAPGGPFR
ncbi:MAG TPA: hypothetical protein VK742_10050 [Candidatus Sulfotelmatobacter sp.]|nr:hypothetical protein [Candidatus Sulfotelmatobacter sp.]